MFDFQETTKGCSEPSSTRKLQIVLHDWPLQIKGDRSYDELTAVVVGAGPSGTAAAIELARLAYRVILVDQRQSNARGNPVSIREEFRRRLQQLGALGRLESRGQIVPTVMKFSSAWAHIQYRPRDTTPFTDPSYKVPERLTDQLSTHSARICDLEHALLQAAVESGVTLITNATINLSDAAGTRRKHVRLLLDYQAYDLGFPDLVVYATGDKDQGLLRDLKVDRNIGCYISSADLALLKDRIVPRTIGELEVQNYITFGLRAFEVTSTSVRCQPVMEIQVEKYRRYDTEQPIFSAYFDHYGEYGFALQLPRNIKVDHTSLIEEFVLTHINKALQTAYRDLAEITNCYHVVYGSLTTTFTVSSSVLDSFAFGSNTIVVGDAAGSSCPGPGLGSQSGTGIDSQLVSTLARGFQERARLRKPFYNQRSVCSMTPVEISNPSSEDSSLKSQLVQRKTRDELLFDFCLDKARTLEVWGNACRAFFLSKREAAEFTEQ